MNKKSFYLKILYDVFVASVVTLVVFFISEIIKPGFITNYFNLSLFLLWCILIGIIYVLINKKD